METSKKIKNAEDLRRSIEQEKQTYYADSKKGRLERLALIEEMVALLGGDWKLAIHDDKDPVAVSESLGVHLESSVPYRHDGMRTIRLCVTDAELGSHVPYRRRPEWKFKQSTEAVKIVARLNENRDSDVLSGSLDEKCVELVKWATDSKKASEEQHSKVAGMRRKLSDVLGVELATDGRSVYAYGLRGVHKRLLSFHVRVDSKDSHELKLDGITEVQLLRIVAALQLEKGA